jgi:hypothetical protein
MSAAQHLRDFGSLPCRAGSVIYEGGAAAEEAMDMTAPPEPPAVALADQGGSDRLRIRLHQVAWSAATVLITAWCVTLGTLPAIVSISLAKHILVAILVMGLGVDEPRRSRR